MHDGEAGVGADIDCGSDLAAECPLLRRGQRAEIVLPVLFGGDVPWEVRERASRDLSNWVNILVGVVPYVEGISDLTELSSAAHVLEVSVTCALEALFASPRR